MSVPQELVRRYGNFADTRSSLDMISTLNVMLTENKTSQSVVGIN